eukprot:6208149-Pleurochrysis_carterae.AAC.1
MGWAYNLLEEAMISAAEDGAYLLEPTFFSIFSAIADKQSLFKNYLKNEQRSEKVRFEGTKIHAKFETMLAEAQTPSNATNKAVTEKTAKLVEVMAAAAIFSM